MNIDVSIMIDGQAVKTNDELKNTLDSIVTNYIKNKFFSKNTVVIPSPHEPKIKKKYTIRPKMNEADYNALIVRAGQLQHLVMNKAIMILKTEFNRSEAGIWSKIKKEVNKGNLKFISKYEQKTAATAATI